MLNQLNFFISNQLKQKRLQLNVINDGFTLIELLVAMLIAFLVITPLLGFMINIMDTDRREQAKVNSEQETQAALDYITQDLQQAIYIYDAKGIKAIKDQLPYKDDTDRVPVMVFWKRQFQKEAINVTSKTSVKANDSFVYSLVAYYLIQNNDTNDKDKIWSRQFRIARFEVNDGVVDPDKPTKADDSPNYIKNPDEGFALFKLSDPAITGTLEDKMNAWKKKTDKNYTNKAETLIDYIDASKDSSLAPVDCTEVFNISELPNKDDKKKAILVPAFKDDYSYSTNTNLNNNSFYACVDIDKTSAKIFIRGNALARIDKQNNTYNSSNTAYFPRVSIQVKGRGLIGVE